MSLKATLREITIGRKGEDDVGCRIWAIRWRSWAADVLHRRTPWGAYGIPLPVWAWYRSTYLLWVERRIARQASRIGAHECADCLQIISMEDARYEPGDGPDEDDAYDGRWLCVDCWREIH